MSLLLITLAVWFGTSVVIAIIWGAFVAAGRGGKDAPLPPEAENLAFLKRQAD